MRGVDGVTDIHVEKKKTQSFTLNLIVSFASLPVVHNEPNYLGYCYNNANLCFLVLN